MFAAASSLLLLIPLSPAQAEDAPQHNCFVRLTNDHVERVYMLYEHATSAAGCRAKAARFAAEANLASMRDSVRVLFYEVEYNGRSIAKVDLKH